jgi:hypothetical protein
MSPECTLPIEYPMESMRLVEEMLLELVRWALTWAGVIDKKKSSSFPNSHPRVWHLLTTEFEVGRYPVLTRGFALFRRIPEKLPQD